MVETGANVFFIGSLEDPNFPTTERYWYYWNTLLENKFVHFVSKSKEEIIYEYQGIKCFLYSQNTIISNFCNLLDTLSHTTTVITSMEHCSDFIKIAKERRLYTIGWLHSSNREGMEALNGQPDLLLSTSYFIQQQAKKYSDNLNYVFYPAFDSVSHNYTEGTALTFINPVKEKGAEFILNLAT